MMFQFIFSGKFAKVRLHYIPCCLRSWRFLSILLWCQPPIEAPQRWLWMSPFPSTRSEPSFRIQSLSFHRRFPDKHQFVGTGAPVTRLLGLAKVLQLSRCLHRPSAPLRHWKRRGTCQLKCWCFTTSYTMKASVCPIWSPSLCRGAKLCVTHTISYLNCPSSFFCKQPRGIKKDLEGSILNSCGYVQRIFLICVWCKTPWCPTASTPQKIASSLALLARGCQHAEWRSPKSKRRWVIRRAVRPNWFWWWRGCCKCPRPTSGNFPTCWFHMSNNLWSLDRRNLYGSFLVNCGFTWTESFQESCGPSLSIISITSSTATSPCVPWKKLTTTTSS